MEWPSDGGKLHGTSDPAEIIAVLNLSAKEKVSSGIEYYLLSENRDVSIISNVPPSIYENEDLKKYPEPSRETKLQTLLIKDLQDNIDIMQSEFDATDRYENGKIFQLNQCFFNSQGMFHLVNHLSNIGIIKPKPRIKIVLGFMVSRIPFGTNIGDIVIENTLLLLHDWHVWNYVNDILVDLTIFKHGNLVGLDCNVTSWGSAKDHVFVHPPHGIEYCGAAYDAMDTFEKKIAAYFPQ
ncbi:MAG: hypothetical protein NTV58_06655 [Deltaproteobacteria bacterium]|nr:hypothetical protein [Deltaproteobacteria bacterium]